MPLYIYLLFFLLFLCLLSAFTCFVERVLYLRSISQKASQLCAGLSPLLEEKKWKEACLLCEKQNHVFAEIVQSGLIQQAHGRTRMQSSLEEAGICQIRAVARPIDTLYLIAQIAPWIGLLAALLAATQFFVQEPSVEAMSSIMQHAFLAMALGLVIAIPSLIGYHVLKMRLERCVVEMEGLTDNILTQLAFDEAPLATKIQLRTEQTDHPLPIWNLSYLLISLLLLIVCVLSYHVKWKNVSNQWRVFALNEKGNQAAIQVIVDAQHVLYVGEDRQIVSLDGVLEAIQMRLKHNKKESVLVRIDPSVDSALLLPLLAELEGFSVQMDLLE